MLLLERLLNDNDVPFWQKSKQWLKRPMTDSHGCHQEGNPATEILHWSHLSFWGNQLTQIRMENVGLISETERRELMWSLRYTWVIDDAKCIVVTLVCVSVCLCVCLSTAACPHYCMNPDVTWGSGRGCPLVVHCWADLQSVHGLRCCGNITRTLVKACVHPAIWRHSANARQGLRALLAGNWPSTGGRSGNIKC